MTNTNIGQNILNVKKVTTYSKDENGKTNYKNVKEYDDNENLIWEAKDEENDDIFEYQIHYGENGNTLEYFDNNSDGKADYITAMGKEMSILLEDADEDGTIDSAMRKFNYIEGTDKEEKKYTEEFYDKNGNLVLSLNDKNGDRLTDNFVFEGEKCDFFLADLTEGIYGIYQSFRRFFNIN